MAKKVSKPSTSKKTKKKTPSKKKAASSARPVKKSDTKKKTTTKKTTKKTSTKKAPSKKAPAKKPSTKKAPVKKAPAKKTTSKKVTKKSTTKKTTSKKPAVTTSKKTTKKPASTSKKTTTKKTTSKSKAGTTKKTTKKKSAGKGKGEDAPRFRRAFASSYDDGMQAAAKLAQAAGISGLNRASAEAKKQKSFRKVTKSPFKPEQLAEFREMLIGKRRQLVGDVSSMEHEALSRSESSSHTPNHMADQGSDTYDQTLNLDLAASQRTMLNDIDDALVRISTGVYGICELLGKPIKAERLRNTPWARFSIEAARMIEDDPSLLRRSPGSDSDSDDG